MSLKEFTTEQKATDPSGVAVEEKVQVIEDLSVNDDFEIEAGEFLNSSDSEMKEQKETEDKGKRLSELKQEALLVFQSIQQKEKELERVTHDVDWLQSRIERLDQQNHQDQELLLADTRKIKEIVMAEFSRKDFWSRLAFWKG